MSQENKYCTLIKGKCKGEKCVQSLNTRENLNVYDKSQRVKAVHVHKILGFSIWRSVKTFKDGLRFHMVKTSKSSTMRCREFGVVLSSTDAIIEDIEEPFWESWDRGMKLSIPIEAVDPDASAEQLEDTEKERVTSISIVAIVIGIGCLALAWCFGALAAFAQASIA